MQHRVVDNVEQLEDTRRRLRVRMPALEQALLQSSVEFYEAFLKKHDDNVHASERDMLHHLRRCANPSCEQKDVIIRKAHEDKCLVCGGCRKARAVAYCSTAFDAAESMAIGISFNVSMMYLLSLIYEYAIILN